MKPVVAITVGDYNGIGPEVALKSLTDPRVAASCVPLLVGPASAFRGYARISNFRLPFVALGDSSGAAVAFAGAGAIPVVEPPVRSRLNLRPGILSRQAGHTAAAAIREAAGLALRGDVDALVTAPVSKAGLHRAGHHFPGQTEMLQRICGIRTVAMMLVNPSFRIGLVTIHEPVRDVARLITRDLLRDRIVVIAHALRTDWGISSPRVAVLGLNPHAGEGGGIGTEERTIIEPELRRLRRKGIDLEGPFPADAFFARGRQAEFDVVIAMYHDQGLIPLKMSARGRGVNVTAGLPFIRTSPDHGTGLDIAGRGTADASSMTEAILLAVQLSRRRRRTQQAGVL